MVSVCVCVKLLYTPVIFLGTVCITEMAEVVVPAQVFQQLIIIKVTVIAEFAERVSSVAGVIRVSVCSVTCQFLTGVPLALVGEDLVGEVTFKEQVSDSTGYRVHTQYLKYLEIKHLYLMSIIYT